MGDLISRLAAIDAICYNCIETELCNGTCDDTDRLRELPIIDAVPVVRCKDCRWKEEEQPGMVYCPATVGGWVDEDWFCKGGERNEDERDNQ